MAGGRSGQTQNGHRTPGSREKGLSAHEEGESIPEAVLETTLERRKARKPTVQSLQSISQEAGRQQSACLQERQEAQEIERASRQH